MIGRRLHGHKMKEGRFWRPSQDTLLYLFVKNGAAGEIRTLDLVLRRHALYPSELQPHVTFISCGAGRSHFELRREIVLVWRDSTGGYEFGGRDFKVWIAIRGYDEFICPPSRFAEKLNHCHSEARCVPRNLSFPRFKSQRDSSLRSE